MNIRKLKILDVKLDLGFKGKPKKKGENKENNGGTMPMI
jgi:hypothetical protein